MSEPPTLEYGRAKAKNRWLMPVLIAVLGLLGITLVVPELFRRPHNYNPIRCASNLRSIGQGLMLYVYDNGGAMAPDFETMRLAEQLGPEVFICRLSNDTRALSNESVALPGRCSYVYTGQKVDPTGDPKCVAAFEDPANHYPEGANVLFADGRVEFADLPTIMQIINDLAAGKNPPSPTTFTQKSAKKDYEANWQARMPEMKAGPWPTPTTRPAKQPARDQ